MNSAPSFRRGGKDAEQEAKRQNAFAKVQWFSIADKESVILRFIDDSPDWIYANQHNMVPTKGAPENATKEEKDRYPATMGAICRYDKAFTGMFKGCYICDHMKQDNGKAYKPSLRVWARAVEREVVEGTPQMVEDGKITAEQVGRKVGYRDKLMDHPVLDEKGEPTGRTEKVRKIIVIRMGVKNFFGAMQGYYDVYGTVLSRDFHVTREGQGLETDYKIVPLDPIPGFSLADPATKAQYEIYSTQAGVNLEEVITGQASDDYYARFFDPTQQVAKKKSDNSSVPEDQQAKPESTAPTEEALRAMRERVRSGHTRAPEEEPSVPLNLG